jgi:dihydrofolate reductase
MSVNGFIAKENDEAPWSQEIWDSYYHIAKKFKSIVLGRKTYEIMKEANEFEKIGNPFITVITSKNYKSTENTVFVKSPTEAIALLKHKGFSEALLAGGSQLNTSFMKENLVDEIYLDIEPVVFGKGISLFSEGDFDKKLKLIESKKISDNVVQLHYKVLPHG